MKPTIFIVDDDEGIRDSLRLVLEMSGYSVTEFSNGDDFLECANFERPSCVVLDVNLPGIGGIEALERLRARGVGVPVIVVSGHLNSGIKAMASRLGAVVVFDKPVFGNELLAAIAEVSRANGYASDR